MLTFLLIVFLFVSPIIRINASSTYSTSGVITFIEAYHLNIEEYFHYALPPQIFSTMVSKRLIIRGMLCDENCGARVRAALAAVPGVNKVDLDFASKEATVEGAPQVTVSSSIGC